MCAEFFSSKINIVALFLYPALSESKGGGGWTLVRRAKGSSWSQAVDSLAGTEEYGQLGHETSDHSFSIRFNDTKFNQFLFSTGKTDFEKLI